MASLAFESSNLLKLQLKKLLFYQVYAINNIQKTSFSLNYLYVNDYG